MCVHLEGDKEALFVKIQISCLDAFSCLFFSRKIKDNEKNQCVI